MSIFFFSQNLVPRIAAAASLDGSDLALRAGKEFIRLGLYKDDPLVSIVNRKSGDGRPVVQCSAPAASTPAPGRRRFYLSLGLTERITIVDRAKAGWISLNFYRTDRSAPLPSTAVEDLVSDASILHAIVSKHIELTQNLVPEHNRAELLWHRLEQLCDSLTERETEVCVLALQGKTNAEIGVALGIQPSTVSTLRHRAYDRLGVSNLVEIFLKCLVLPG